MSKKNSRKLSISFFISSLLAAWLLLNCVRTANNIWKIWAEERYWIGLSIDQKNEKLFGQSFSLYKYLNRRIPQGSRVLIYSHDDKTYLYERYKLYPTLVYRAHSLKQFMEKIELIKPQAIVLIGLKIQEQNEVLKITGGNFKQFLKSDTYIKLL